MLAISKEQRRNRKNREWEQFIVESYVKRKRSVRQIAQELALSEYTVRGVLRKHTIKMRTQSESATVLYQTRDGYRASHMKKCVSSEDRLLKVAGLMLYFGEGTKEGSTVALANSNPSMVKLFIAFLLRICRVEASRIHITLHYYSDQSEKELKKFWSAHTGIPIEQFYKSFEHKTGRGTYKQLSKYGTVSLRYADTALLRTINAEIVKYVSSVTKKAK